jgi:sugar O-acyltransferase (sialic acid O-acetyltransferase NeuD family)
MDSLKELYIIGAGGLGREVADIVDSVNQRTPSYRLAGFVDDNEELRGSLVNGIPVFGGRGRLGQLAREREIHAVIAIADTGIKKTIARELDDYINWVNIIHPMAVVSKHCEMGRGNIVQAFCHLAANARLGDHCIINVSSLVGHDAVLGDCVSVMCFCAPNGNVRLESGAYLGSHVMIIPGLTVGEDAFICAGSCVFHDVEAGAVMRGNPARRVR